MCLELKLLLTTGSEVPDRGSRASVIQGLDLWLKVDFRVQSAPDLRPNGLNWEMDPCQWLPSPPLVEIRKQRSMAKSGSPILESVPQLHPGQPPWRYESSGCLKVQLRGSTPELPGIHLEAPLSKTHKELQKGKPKSTSTELSTSKWLGPGQNWALSVTLPQLSDLWFDF
jgi:hypothetical protein